MQVTGIDISKWQGKFDFIKAQAQGYKFCFIKATEGASHSDKEFERNWTEGPKHGLLVGAYHFYRPGVDPMEQVENHLNKVGSLPHAALPCVLDLEVTDGVRNSEILHGAKVWVDAVHERTGKMPILYSGPSYIKERGGMKDFIGCPLWIAHYGVSRPKVPKPFVRWSFWQYTSAGNLDKNLFNGTIEELRALAGIGSVSNNEVI